MCHVQPHPEGHGLGAVPSPPPPCSLTPVLAPPPPPLDLLVGRHPPRAQAQGKPAETCTNLTAWFPPESGVLERIEKIHATFPDGFKVGTQQRRVSFWANMADCETLDIANIASLEVRRQTQARWRRIRTAMKMHVLGKSASSPLLLAAQGPSEVRLTIRKSKPSLKCGVSFSSPSLTALPAATAANAANASANGNGNGNGNGALVKSCIAGGLAEQAGLRPGDRLARVVTSAGHTVVGSAKQAAELLARAEGEMVLVVERDA